MAIPKRSFTADYVESCNCDHGCPCPKQREAILQIFSGQAGGNGSFALFAPTFVEYSGS